MEILITAIVSWSIILPILIIMQKHINTLHTDLNKAIDTIKFARDKTIFVDPIMHVRRKTMGFTEVLEKALDELE